MFAKVKMFACFHIGVSSVAAMLVQLKRKPTSNAALMYEMFAYQWEETQRNKEKETTCKLCYALLKHDY